jgi:hypothetical protein
MSWKHVALASAVAGLFASAVAAPAAAEGTEGQVKCEGVNACKGHSACKTAKNACKGENGCAGTGFVMLTPAECDAAKAKAAEKNAN